MLKQKSDTRTRILKTVWKLMEENRGQGVRMSDIAKAAGVSRQAVYLHFDDRADLLIATTHYMDEVLGVEKLLEPSRTALDGESRLREFIIAMAHHYANIQGMAQALLAIKETDAEARIAWDERMEAIRHGCGAAIDMIESEGRLVQGWTKDVATDLLWSLLSFESWDRLINGCDWKNDEYVAHVQRLAEHGFVAGQKDSSQSA
ncbi:MAG: TetR/AcrR family transcriptional regulator [Stappiaceae bacterium]